MGVTQLDMTSPKNRNEDIFRRTVNVEKIASKAMVAIDGAGFDWSYMADDEVPTNMALMAFSNSEVYNDKTCSKTCLKCFETFKTQLDDLRIEFNKSKFNLATYKKGLASVQEQLVFYKKNEVIFGEQIAVLKRDISYKDSEISMLKNELEKLKQEKESDQLKIENFDNASKSLDKLIGSQIPENSRKGVGFVSYNDVPPLTTGLFSPPKLDLSNFGLEEFQQPEFEGYGPKTSYSVSEDISNEVKESPDAPLVKKSVSDDKLEKKTVFSTVAKIGFVRSKQQEKPVRKPGNSQLELQEKGVIDSGCSTHMTGNMSYLFEYKEIDGGYVAFGGDPKGGKITGKGKISIDTECVVLSPEFKLLDEVKSCLEVLVIKPHNKTPYELFNGRTPSLSFMRPFGYPVTILSTLDPLGNQSNGSACKARVETVSNKDYILLPLWTQDLLLSSSSKDSLGDWFKLSWEEGKKDAKDLGNEDNEVLSIEEPRVIQEKDANVNSTNNINTVSQTDNAAGIKDNVVDENIVYGCANDPNMPNLEEIVYSNDNDHPDEKIIRDIHSAPQTRRITKNVTNHEPKKVIQALTNLSWIEAMQDELLQFKLQQGHTQEEGIHYDEVFAPVARIEEIRLFLAYASFKDFVVYQMDVKSAFLYGKIEEEVYVCQPLGFEDPKFPDRVYKVENALYGLHQALRAWYETLSTYLLDNRFHKEKSAENVDFAEIVDFLNANPIKYALTMRLSMRRGKTEWKGLPLLLLAKKQNRTVTRHQDTILGDTPAQTWFERLSKQSYEPPLSRVNTLGSGEDRCSSFGNSKVTEESQEIGKEKKVKKSTTQEKEFHLFKRIAKTQERYDHDIEVNIASTSITTASINITTTELITTVSAPITTAGEYEVARRLKAQLQAEFEEEERVARQREEEANLILRDNTQAMMDADYELAQRLQAKEHEELTIKERLKLFVELMDKRKKHFAKLKAEEIRRKPPAKAQIRSQMCTYLKNMANYKHSQLKNRSFKEILILFDNTIKWINSFAPTDLEVLEDSGKKAERSRIEAISKKRTKELDQESSKRKKTSESLKLAKEPIDNEADKLSQEELQQIMIIVLVQGMNVEALQTKDLIIDCEIYTKGTEKYWKIIRDGNHTELYDSCGVHHVSIEKEIDIYMLVEKEYPLSRGTLTLMLIGKLLVDQDNEISRELLRKIFMQAERPRK
nr:hypothetical protein [Tanacetum cinerariifolium]